MGYVAIAVVFLLLWVFRVKHFHWLTGEWKGDKKKDDTQNDKNNDLMA